MPSRNHDRKLVQWALGYLAGGWVILQVLELVAESFAWPPVLMRVTIVLVVAGFPAVLILGWYHGEKGRQRVSPTEVALLALVGVLALVSVLLVTRIDDTSPPTSLRSVGEVGTDPLDSTRYAVFSFRREGGARSDVRADALIHDALSRWEGISVADLYGVRDAVGSAAGAALTLRDQREIARELEAGRLVRGHVTRLGDRYRLHAAAHDVRTGALLANATADLPADGEPGDSVFGRIAASLLFGADEGGMEEAARDPGTRSYPARLAFLRAEEKLRQWDLDAADSVLAVAGESDGEYARALLQRALVQNWNGREPAELVGLLGRALAGPQGLTSREVRLAEALHDLGRERYGEACDAYRSLVAEDEGDFAAWFSLGECHWRDKTVVRDPESSSGWSFRRSKNRAMEAYRRAFELLPSVVREIRSVNFWELRNRLFTGSGKVVEGRAPSPDTLRFAARPALAGDTLAVVPYPTAEFAAGNPATRPRTHAAAVERQRRIFHELASSWVTALPRSAGAWQALAAAQELLGDETALETLRTARSLATDPAKRIEIAGEEVVSQIKFGVPDDLAGLRRAHALADTLLGEAPSRQAAGLLAVTAVFVGRVHEAARLAQRAAGPEPWPVELPASVTGPAAGLLAYVALGAPAESIVAYEARVDAAIRNRTPPKQRSLARHFLLDRAASLAFLDHPLGVWTTLAETSAYRLLRAEAALARGDSAEAHAILLRSLEARRDLRPAEVSLETVFPEARLWAALGDTARATGILDPTLDELRWMEPGMLDDVARASALLRAMAFRAELALARGNPAVARRWAAPVAVLWENADAPLQPIVRRMTSIAGASTLTAASTPSHPPQSGSRR